MTIADGPLYVSRGSHRNSLAKLRWMHSLTVPPAEQALKEPALRLFGDPTALGFKVPECDIHLSRCFVPTMAYAKVTTVFSLCPNRPWSLCFRLKAPSAHSCLLTLQPFIVVAKHFLAHGEHMRMRGSQQNILSVYLHYSLETRHQ